MASTYKTFTDGDILTAADVNNALNPQTADHVARSTHAQILPVTVAVGSRFADATVSWPAGRFSQNPIVVASIHGSAGDVSAVARCWATGVTSGVVRVGVPANVSGSAMVVQVAILATQMGPNSAQG